MAANVAVAQDPAGNLKPAKDKSTERIDGIVALIMAHRPRHAAPGDPVVPPAVHHRRQQGALVLAAATRLPTSSRPPTPSSLPRYAKQAVDQQFARWVMLHVQSNPLPICTRPRVLIKGKRT